MLKNLLKRKLNKKGFTLVELIIVIIILAILAAVLVPLIGGYVREAQNNTVISNARNAYMAAVMVTGSTRIQGGVIAGEGTAPATYTHNPGTVAGGFVTVIGAAANTPAGRISNLIRVPGDVFFTVNIDGDVTAFQYREGTRVVEWIHPASGVGDTAHAAHPSIAAGIAAGTFRIIAN